MAVEHSTFKFTFLIKIGSRTLTECCLKFYYLSYIQSVYASCLLHFVFGIQIVCDLFGNMFYVIFGNNHKIIGRQGLTCTGRFSRDAESNNIL